VSEEHAWMQPALEALFESVDVDAARAAILSEDRRAELRSKLNLGFGDDMQIPAGQFADNLLQGLLALRMKFDRAEAMAKLELNLSMRAQRGHHS
jgi:hypothetical protein